MDKSCETLTEGLAENKEVTGVNEVSEDHKFIGFDASKAMDCLCPGDVAIMATPPAFRWVFFRGD